LRLEASQRHVAGSRLGGGTTVVAEEEDERVLFQPEAPQRVEHASHGVVQGGGHGGVDTTLLVLDGGEAVEVSGDRLQRRVHGIEGQVDEERLRAVLLDERHRFPPEGVGQVLLLDDRLHAPQDRVALAPGRRDVVVRPAQEAEELVEAAFSGETIPV
jgi:hypothetical protein